MRSAARKIEWNKCSNGTEINSIIIPPDSPAFSNAAPKRAHKETLSEAIGTAAVAIVKALKSDPNEIIPSPVVQSALESRPVERLI